MSCFFVIQYCDKSFWALSLDYCVINLLCFLLFIMLYKHNMAKDPDNGFFPKQVSVKKKITNSIVYSGGDSPISSIVFPLLLQTGHKKRLSALLLQKQRIIMMERSPLSYRYP